MKRHPQDCACDICTHHRSWTSTEEYLIWSSGATLPEPPEETEEEALERQIREGAAFYERMGRAQAPHNHGEPCPICGGNHSKAICQEII